MKIATFQYDDLGFENPQYFQGYGTSFTSYDESAYGVGDTIADAITDCLEQIASGSDVDVEDLETRLLIELGVDSLDDLSETSAVEEFGDDTEMTYHFGIKWTV